MSYDGLLRFDGLIDEKYNDVEMIEILGLDRNKPICDGYGHARSCIRFVQELKPRKDIKRALEQLRSTVEQLEEKGKEVAKIFLIADGIGKTDRNFFKTENGLLKKKADNAPVFIQGKEIRFITRNQLSQESAKWYLR